MRRRKMSALFSGYRVGRAAKENKKKYQQVHSDKSLSGAGSPTCDQYNNTRLQKIIKRQTEPYGKAMK